MSFLVALTAAGTVSSAAARAPEPGSQELLVPKGRVLQKGRMGYFAKKAVAIPEFRSFAATLKEFAAHGWPMLQKAPEAGEGHHFTRNIDKIFWNFDWMKDDAKLPDLLKGRQDEFLGRLNAYVSERGGTLTEEGRQKLSERDRDRFSPLKAAMLKPDDAADFDTAAELLLGDMSDWRGTPQILTLAAGSGNGLEDEGGGTLHAETRWASWLKEAVENVVRQVAPEGTPERKIREARRAIFKEPIDLEVGARTNCNTCKAALESDGVRIKRATALTFYDKAGSPMATRSSIILKDLVPVFLNAYDGWVEKGPAVARAQINGKSDCPGSSGVQEMVMAAAASPCGGSSALGKALAQQKLGGVDFTRLQLRYMSDDAGAKVKYAFSTAPGKPGAYQNGAEGRAEAIVGMADLRTWLVLGPNTFWVNLNPDQPDRIIDPKLGQTYAGRALLDADWHMKQTSAKLLDPKTALGSEFWDKFAHTGKTSCYSSRLWIVPGDVQVRESGDSLYVLKADLRVRTEPIDLSLAGRSACNTDPQATAHNAALDKRLIIPKVQKAVNTDPQYAPIRQAFMARVVAQWIRDRHAEGHRTSFDKLIDSGNLGPAKLKGPWRPQQVFQNYVRAVKEGDFTYHYTRHVGGTTMIYKLTVGGVDFSKVHSSKLSEAAMNKAIPGLEKTVRSAGESPSKASDGSIWLGDTATGPGVSTLDRITGFLTSRNGVLVAVGAGVALLLFFIRDGSTRRRKSTSAT
ncbi:hypothetical protein [Streptomyces beihaiensis]|uniref:Uncharacterized protein n=1 Tax=Streptomyces beihaiensis TaxID=2984495 RepID=A0ABT3TTY3_9ACTN|nr:hypothetical protein [Streptomyces beihaiensis]MCX3059986.1 hypothetical protein [Streptomyces beihaiensis]